MKRLRTQNTIVSKLTRLILGIVILQTLLIGTILITAGVIEQSEENAYQMFYDKVNKRKDYIQREMKNNWTNIDPYATNISKLLSGHELDKEYSAFFSKASEELIPMLRTTQATGAFIVLIPEDRSFDEYPSLYLRDYDPIMNAYSDDDIYMVYGPPELARNLKIPLDQVWGYAIKGDTKDDDFIQMPYQSAEITSKATLLGYWSKPFKLKEDDVEIVTYSMPLFNSGGELKGIIGIELTVNYLTSFMPANELQPRDSLGYLIAYGKEDKSQIEPIIMGGALQKRMIDSNQALSLSIVDSDRNIHKIDSHNGEESLFAVVDEIGLYSNNTPFKSDRWFLVGIMREDYLLMHSNRIQQTLLLSLAIAIIIGAMGAFLISAQMTKPIVALVDEVKNAKQDKVLTLKHTGLMELDELSNAVVVANRRMLESATKLQKIVELTGLPMAAYEVDCQEKTIFITENFYALTNGPSEGGVGIDAYESFLLLINRLKEQVEEGEMDVYRLGVEPERWIRINEIKQNTNILGVVMDVTNEIVEKKKIQSERDQDPLTQLLNRKGFQYAFENWRSKEPNGTSALIMLDLDHLKTINDTYGHHWGDEYIVATVAHLKNMGSENHIITGRRSGDEFIVLLYDYATRDSILEAIDAFYSKLNQSLIRFPDGQMKPIRLSAGLTWVSGKSASYEDLLNLADEALYEAKRNQKGQYVVNEIVRN